MGFLKRLCYTLGLILGLASVAVAGAAFLTYLFTGKFPVVNVDDKGAKMDLLSADQVTALIRSKRQKPGEAALPVLELK